MDYFDNKTSPGSYYFLQVFIHAYAISIFAYLVLVENISVTDTYLHGGGTPGEYFTLRYNSLQWYALMLATTKIFMVPFVCFMILYRKWYGCNILWFVLICTIVVIDGVVIMALGHSYSGCNQPGQLDNICNDNLYCCLPSINGDPSNGCPFSGVCPSKPTTALSPNSDFLWLFYTNLVYMLADAAILIFFAVMFAIFPAYDYPYSRGKIGKGE